MHAFYSLWTTPMLGKMSAGYRSAFDLWVSFAVSMLRSRELFDSVTFVTDRIGAEISELLDLRDICRTQKNLHLIRHRDPRIWIQGKLEAYRAMHLGEHRGSVHLDGDVVFWKEFPWILNDRSLIAQSPEEEERNFYKHLLPVMAEIPEEKMPSFWNEDIQRWRDGEKLGAYNLGFVGGRDTSFMDLYASEVLWYLSRYPEVVDALPKDQIQRSNFVWEQWMFAAAARTYDVPVQTLLPECRGDGSDEPMAAKWGYTHAFGSRLKNDADFLFRMERRLEYTDPDLRRRIYRVFRPDDRCEPLDTSMLS